MALKGTLLTTLVIYIILCDSIYATYVDLAERKRSSGEELLKRAGVMSDYKPWSMGRDRRYRFMHMTDAGYGSRLFVTSRLVRALFAQRNIFGVYGPGKKK
ncbi:uncharacterized protein LOC132721877 [Ruditapes philippinarum]|uniref:uncharacterized protein LOC132721877 n=1 Tax=Ruditapes philippinarum TaxID=129788 RepID=UPI00295AC91A|nr:uncharacterized protein LOC132721877 [Ruditapes philippinarum]